MTSHCSLPEGQPENCTGVWGEEGAGRGGADGVLMATRPAAFKLRKYTQYIYIDTYIYILSVKRDKPLCVSPIPRFHFGGTDIQGRGRAGKSREE